MGRKKQLDTEKWGRGNGREVGSQMPEKVVEAVSPAASFYEFKIYTRELSKLYCLLRSNSENKRGTTAQHALIVIPALQRLRQDCHEFEASLSYRKSLCCPSPPPLFCFVFLKEQTENHRGAEDISQWLESLPIL